MTIIKKRNICLYSLYCKMKNNKGTTITVNNKGGFAAATDKGKKHKEIRNANINCLYILWDSAPLNTKPNINGAIEKTNKA